ncbi:MAG: glycosyltransferase family 1 protein [Rhodobacterales bacterium CG15_BIG_FIL_POST_REV_8_21_14_020_59_13]|nr:MAG: glycosyltransferase family 1 protein [Rhodobacterales bacterium CG15_BIG_FIL_POST_REV_8_21_14_020_59_13]
MDRALADIIPESPLAGPPEGETLALHPRRVLLTGYRSHPHVGGQGVYLRELAIGLCDLGHDVTIASGPPYPDVPEGVALVKFPALNLFEEKNAFLALRPGHLFSKADRSEWLAHNTGAFGELLAFSYRLQAWLRGQSGRFDVLHDNQTLMPPFARISRTLPVIATIHHPVAIDRGFAIDGVSTWWEKLLTRRWYGFTGQQAKTMRQLPYLLAVSEAARDSHCAHYGMEAEQAMVSFNGIDHAVFRPDDGTERASNLIAATASADVPIKGLDVLMRAFVPLARQYPALKLEMIGQLRDGHAKQILGEAGLMDRVTTRSGVSREEIADLYRRASVVVCPARFEGFGFPAAEAMACGAPVVASDGGALPEVVGDAGSIVPAGDAAALETAIRAVLNQPDMAREMGEAGMRRAREVFCWRNHALAASALYEKAIAAC